MDEVTPYIEALQMTSFIIATNITSKMTSFIIATNVRPTPHANTKDD